MSGQDVIYPNLAGRLEEQARSIVNAMEAVGINRRYHSSVTLAE